VQVGKISRFGLMEMSRQRLRPSLGETRNEVCPRCKGQGTIRGVESLALSITRLIEEEAFKDRTAEVRAILPVSVATFLLNEKRKHLAEIERRQQIKVVIIPNPHFDTPHYEVQRIRDDNATANEASYQLQVGHDEQDAYEAMAPKKIVRPEAAVKSIAPLTPAPAPTPAAASAAPTKEEIGLLKRLSKKIAGLFGAEERAPSQPASDTARQERQPRNKQRHDQPRNQPQANAARASTQGGAQRADRQQERSQRNQERGQDRNAERNQGRPQERNQDRQPERTQERAE